MHRFKKRSWGTIGTYSSEQEREIAQDIVSRVRQTEISVSTLLKLWKLPRSTYYGWTSASSPKGTPRYCATKALEHEVETICEYRRKHPSVGYRKLTWMMNDERVAALSETAVYRILKEKGLLTPWLKEESDPAEKQYRHKPTRIHEHWHTDIAYVKIRGTFYFLIMMLDGYSRYLLGWELMTDMTTRSVELFTSRIREQYPNAQPKLITDNGSAFVSSDYKRLLARIDIQHIRTRIRHPETNGKAERFVQTARAEGLRPSSPASFAEACAVLTELNYVYNHHRLHAGINFFRPADLFHGREREIHNARVQRIRAARAFRIEANSFAQKQKVSTISECKLSGFGEA